METGESFNESISRWISTTEMLALDSSEASDAVTAPPLTFDNLSTNFTFNMNSSLNHNQQSWITIAIIPLYSVIFLLAVIGNSLVILTLVQNKRMRTITNLFLLNLAASDLFLGVFCMPFTLLGMLLRDFIFGEFMCKMLPYLQATSVSVSAWTLVAISVERYYAICHPLRSRQWQTLKHAYKLIILIWTSSLLFMLPIAILSKLIPTKEGHQKCRELWPDKPIEYEKVFNIFLDMILLVLPLFVLGATYFMITKTLWQGIQTERDFKNHLNKYTKCSKNSVEVYISNGGTRSRCSQLCQSQQYPSDTNSSFHQLHNCSQESTLIKNESMKIHVPALRRSNAEKSLLNKKRVIKMLFVVVLEFFICWTPLYVINTITLFDQRIVYQNLGYTAISFFQLLAYSSSCCNPITYCFMNVGFRKAFLNLFRCFSSSNEPTRRVSLSGYGNNTAPVLATTLHGLGNPENNIVNNNNHLLANSSSDNYDFNRQPSFHMHKQEKMTFNEQRRDKQVNNGALT